MHAHETRLVNLPPNGATLKAIERDAALQALERTGWVQCDAARLLGISDRAMHYLIHYRHHLTRPAHLPGHRWFRQSRHDPR